MRVKVTSLFYVICFLGNILHVYQICDEYLRYDVTTNVQVTVPEDIVFPSITLCVDLMDSLNWPALSLDTRRKLMISSYVSESEVSFLLNNPSLVVPTLKKLNDGDQVVLSALFYNQLVNMFTVKEIINITAPIHEVIQTFAITRRAYNESQQDSFSKLDRKNQNLVVLNATEGVKIQFILDMTYIRLKDKCFTLRLRPELQKIINYDDLITRYGRFLFAFESRYNSPMRIYLSSDGYLNTLQDSFLQLFPNLEVKAWFVTHESILLEYPYKSNCRDYKKNGMLSRHQCRYHCFKSMIISRSNRIFEQLYAHESDNLYLRQMLVSNGFIFSDPMPRNIINECQKTCLLKECRSVSHIQLEITRKRLSLPFGNNCSFNDTGNTCRKQKLLKKSLKYSLVVQGHPGTRTETQAAIPLISFLTDLFSTFGFWLGLSVFGSANLMQILCNTTSRNN